MSTIERLVPELPPAGQQLKLLIDTDAANEIDDLYAAALAMAAPERFDLQGLVATHFAASSGPESTQKSYDVLLELFAAAGVTNRYPLKRGSHPMRYAATAEPSEGVSLIIDTARRCSAEDPLWVVVLGAATNMASAILAAPEIAQKVRVIFHGRSEETWPARTRQFNVYGDIIAAQTLLTSQVPLVWFDTGTKLYASMETTEKRLAPLGKLGKYLHEYRHRAPYYQGDTKGFFDLGDIAWMLDPTMCKATIIDAPELTRWMEFNQTKRFGQILHVGEIKPAETWELFYQRLKQRFA